MILYLGKELIFINIMAIKRTKKFDFSKKNFKPLKVSQLNQEHNIKNKNMIGCDETGVGDYLTPLVAAAVYIDNTNVDQLIKLGVKDSKKITDEKIIELFPKIQQFIKYRVNHLTQKGYNNLSKYMNAHELKMFLHLKCITELEKRDNIDEDYILLDAFASVDNIVKYYENLMKSRLKTNEISKEILLSENGEEAHVSVAAASIVARYYFLNMMKEQEEEIGMKFPLGTNSKVEEVAINFCEKFGRKALYEIAKISFKTTEKVYTALDERGIK
ncbi:MAG: ribonuclease HIII [Mycoplasmataceae bacterium]|nr:ribonuclease HIII [Mycoplasmataceae bacterium]